MLRALPVEAWGALGWILDTFMLTAEFPPSFLHGHIYPIPKKGAASVADARPITLLEVTLKCMTHRVQAHLQQYLEHTQLLSTHQFGFRKGRGCPQAIAVLIGAIEDAKARQRELHVVLVDIRKAFDSVETWSLRRAYEAAGLAHDLIKFLSAMDGTGTASCITPSGLSQPRPVERGVRQGEVLSPTKFILWLNMWLQEVQDMEGYTMSNGVRVHIVAYADDIAIIGGSREQVQALLRSLSKFLCDHGVAFNPDKTHYVTTAISSAPVSIEVFNNETRAADTVLLAARPPSFQFRYLGIELTLNQDWERCATDLNNKILGLIALLHRKQLTFGHMAAVADSVIRGRLAYYAQSAQIPRSMIAEWDAKLAALYRKTASLPRSALPHPFARLAWACRLRPFYRRNQSPAMASTVSWTRRQRAQLCAVDGRRKAGASTATRRGASRRTGCLPLVDH